MKGLFKGVGKKSSKSKKSKAANQDAESIESADTRSDTGGIPCITVYTTIYLRQSRH